VLFCDDPFIAELNRKYRKKNRPTDVLAFAQGPLPVRLYRSATPHVLGDIVISLETVERNCRCDRAAMRDEVRLLFCHGILHLLGYQHGTARDLAAMVVKQNDYLGRSARSRPKKR
jgi:probable rRNA maturation factor